MIKENCTYTEFNGVMEAVSTDKGKLSVLQGTFKTIINSVSKFLTKDSRAKLLDKGIEASHGDITKITQINETTLKCLAILKKSKNSETKLDVKQAEALYNALKHRKDTFKQLEHAKSHGSTFERFMGYLMWMHYVLNVKLFVNYVSLILAHEMDGGKISEIKHPFSLRKLVRDELDAFNNGNTDKAYQEIIDSSKKKEAKEDAFLIAIGIGAAGLFALITFELSIRILTFYFYYSRMQLADYFEEQATFLRIHETEVKKNKNLSKAEIDSIINAQRTWANRFSELSEMVIVDEIGSARKVSTQIKDSNKTITPSNINEKNTGLDFF